MKFQNFIIIAILNWGEMIDTNNCPKYCSTVFTPPGGAFALFTFSVHV